MKLASVLFVVFAFIQVTLSFATMGQGNEHRRLSQENLAKSRARHQEVIEIAKGRGLRISGVDSNGRMFGLQKFAPGGIPEYYITFNADAAWQTHTDIVNAIVGGGLYMAIGMWDAAGVRTTHNEFGARVTQMDSPGDLHWHSTHVAGTLVAEGIDAQARGMAYQADLYAWDWDDDYAEMGSAASSNLRISNHSYGYVRGWYYGDMRDVGYDEWFWLGNIDISETEDYLFGFYCSESRTIDSLACVYPEYLIVTSAGNDRNDDHTGGHWYIDPATQTWVWSTAARNPDGGADGYDCIPNGRPMAKNVLTVGAIGDYVTMTDFTSWGPADDGRVKPDIMGHGHTLYSTMDGADDDYGVSSGTSMSCPNVCGSLALLIKDYYAGTGEYMKAATLKALAIHTTYDSWNKGPDYKSGWGVLNTERAYLLQDEDLYYPERGLIEELTIHQAETIELQYVPTGAYHARATICWTDPEGTPPDPAVDPNWVVLVNDIDMEIEHGATTYQPWILDRLNPDDPATTGDNYRDNVEQVYIDDPGDDMFVIRITHKGILLGDQQDFSLVVSGLRSGRAWHVYEDGSGDAPDITTAVSLASDGDHILVHPGTYYEHDINVNKELVLKGLDGPESTIIDAQHLGRCIYLPGFTDSIAVVGFTLQNGLMDGTYPYGGGIYCRNPHVLISDCIVQNNEAEDGGGIYLYEASPHIEDCTIMYNEGSVRGGGIWGLDSEALIEYCLIHHNTTDYDGGGVYLMGTSNPHFENCTIGHNAAPDYGSGIYLATSSSAILNNTIVAFGEGSAGIYGHPYAGGVVMACCDVYGNEGGDYGGSIPDQTGTAGNISEDPLFCDPAGGDYHIYDVSPCAPENNSCERRIGSYGVDCAAEADLIVADVEFDDDHPSVGEQIHATIKVKNIGILKAYDFYIDYYEDLTSPPGPGQAGDQRYDVDSLAAGDSLLWITAGIEAETFERWSSYAQVDTDDSVPEFDDGNNVSGPHDIYWEIPVMEGWPVAGGGDFHSSPAIAQLDDNPRTMEVVIGCDDGKLYAFTAGGDTVAGWPVDIGYAIVSSPAVGDITGDYHNEVVVGCGTYLYAYDRQGQLLWSYGPGQEANSTPALADLDDDGKYEVIFSRISTAGNMQICVLTGGGAPYPGGWPLDLPGTGITSSAVGDVDDDGQMEIAVIVNGFTKPTDNSRVYLLNESGSAYSMNWPVQIDTVVTVPPVLGDIVSDGELEVITGGLDGKVYAINLAGVIWPSPPQVQGRIERSLALGQADKEGHQEIIVSSRFWYEPIPPFGTWAGVVTVLDNDGTIISGWPHGAGSWTAESGMPTPVALYNRVLAGSPGQAVYGWQSNGAAADGFARGVAGAILCSLALGDLDGDGCYDLVAAADSLYCFDLGSSPDYGAGKPMYWPMFRNDRTRCGCYYTQTVTDAGDTGDVTPNVTMLQSIYPNPFNPVTRISFSIDTRARVTIAVYDIKGRRVSVLENKIMNAGHYEVLWHGVTDTGAAAASGIYFCRFSAGDVVQTRKMVLLR